MNLAHCPNHDPHDEHDWDRTIWRPLPPIGEQGEIVVLATYHCLGRPVTREES